MRSGGEFALTGGSPVALVVDDDARSRELLQQVLALDGYRVLQADGGAAALAILARQLPDVVILDQRMPGMDGVQLCRSIRGLANGACRLPLILLTGMDDAATRSAGLDAGADEVIVKPVDLSRLRDRLRQLRSGPAESATP